MMDISSIITKTATYYGMMLAMQTPKLNKSTFEITMMLNN
jgi:hypothetical protein